MPLILITSTLAALHAVQVALSIEGAYHSYLAITNLQQYEDQTETAARYSKTAEEQLHRTQTTEAGGAGALLLSLLASLYLFVHPDPTWLRLVLDLANLLVSMAARVNMADFWRRKTPIPLVRGFNTALDRNEKVQQRLSWLEITWLASALLVGMGKRPGASA